MPSHCIERLLSDDVRLYGSIVCNLRNTANIIKIGYFAALKDRRNRDILYIAAGLQEIFKKSVERCEGEIVACRVFYITNIPAVDRQ